MTVVALVPAAGASRRMGPPKLLLPFGTAGSLLASYLTALARGGVERSLVVVAPGDEALAHEAMRVGAEVATNPRPERGMLSSIWTALDALAEDEIEALVLGPADFPALRAETVRRLLAAVRGGERLAVPTFAGRRGHPLVAAGCVGAEIRSLELTVGLRQLLDLHPGALHEVPVDDPGAVLDVDDEASYRRALRLAAIAPGRSP